MKKDKIKIKKIKTYKANSKTSCNIDLSNVIELFFIYSIPFQNYFRWLAIKNGHNVGRPYFIKICILIVDICDLKGIAYGKVSIHWKM